LRPKLIYGQFGIGLLHLGRLFARAKYARFRVRNDLPQACLGLGSSAR